MESDTRCRPVTLTDWLRFGQPDREILKDAADHIDHLEETLRELRDDPMRDPPAYYNWQRTSEYWRECALFWRNNARRCLEGAP